MPSRSSGRRMPVRIGTRPAGGVRSVETSRSAYRTWPERARDRGGRHQQDVRGAPRRLRLERPALLHAEPVLLVHDGEREVGERHLLLEQRVRPDHDRRLSRRERLGRVPPALAGQRAGQERGRQAEVLEQRGQRRVVLAREEVRRGEQGRLPPVERGGREGPRRDGRLARPDVALDEAEHRDRAGEVVADLVDRRRLVAGERRRLAELPRERGLERRPDPPVGRGVDRDGQRACPSAGAPPRDHPQLEREQLVEREAPERGVAGLERGRVVGVLERLADRRHVLRRPDRLRQVFRVVVAGAVERDAHRRPEAVRGQAAGEPVDGHDPADVEQVRGVGRLELGSLEHQVAVAVLDLARDQELVAGLDAALDVAAPEPGRDREAGAVGEAGRRDLHAPPPRLLDRDVDHADLGRGHRAVVEVAERRRASAARAGRRTGAGGGTGGRGPCRRPAAGRRAAGPRPAGCPTGRPGDARSSARVAGRRRGGLAA